ncbi:MAG: response regulator, partial [Myxococcota bacterium]
LLVDDDELVLRSLRRMLRLAGHQVTTALDGEDALAALRAHEVDLVLSDVWMPRMDGISLLRHVKEGRPDLPVILFTGLSMDHLGRDALAMGAAAFLQKPLEPSDLQRVIEDVTGMSADPQTEET